MEISIEDEAAALGIFISYLEVEGVNVNLTKNGYMKDALEELRSRYTLEKLKENSVIRAYREFYWRIGIDPTKVRPSSEAMVRRVLREGSFPRINNVVDAGNVASALSLVPIGLYDLGRVNRKIVLRLARCCELFHPIGGGEDRMKGGEPVLADEEEVLFLYPHRDSRKTKIREDTRKLLILGAGVPGVEEPRVKGAVNLAADLIIKNAGGRKIGEIKLTP